MRKYVKPFLQILIPTLALNAGLMLYVHELRGDNYDLRTEVGRQRLRFQGCVEAGSDAYGAENCVKAVGECLERCAEGCLDRHNDTEVDEHPLRDGIDREFEEEFGRMLDETIRRAGEVEEAL